VVLKKANLSKLEYVDLCLTVMNGNRSRISGMLKFVPVNSDFN